ncbi:MAG: hypothetical protein AB1349_04140 [Elusimicrobiota bacterium]
MSRRDKLYIIFLLLIVIFQYSEIIFQQKIFFIRDLTYIFQPWKFAVCESLINGKMPLWNPYSYCGMPLLANFQSAVFYPFSVFFYIFGFIPGLKSYIICHTFLAALFLFLYLRSKKIKSIASFTGSVLFAFGGYFITKIEFLSILGAAVWLPLILLFFSSNCNTFICGLAAAISLFAGYPPVLFLIFILLFVETVVEQKYKRFLYVIIFSLLISAVQILPSIELIINSVRKTGLILSDAVAWSMKPADFLALISPVFLEKNITDKFSGEKYFWIKSFWIGFVATIVLLVGVVLSFKKNSTLETKKLVLYFFLVVFSLLFALGTRTCVFQFVYSYVSGFNFIRYPAHILFIPFFIFVMLTATGIHQLRKISGFVSFLILVELLIYAYRIQPIIEYKYYSEKGPVTNFLLSDKSMFRFFLTPKTTWSARIKVPDYGNIGWYVLKDRLQGLSAIPFHLFDAGGVGEPLEITEHYNLITEAQKKNNADEANELLSKMNVKYLLSDYQFPSHSPVESTKWELVFRSHLFVYKNKNFVDRSFIVDNNNNNNKTVEFIIYEPDKIKIETTNSGMLILLDTFYPGWQAFVNGKKTDMAKDTFSSVFRSVKLQNAPNYKIYFLYNPALFILGLLISLLIIGIIVSCDISTFTGI